MKLFFSARVSYHQDSPTTLIQAYGQSWAYLTLCLDGDGVACLESLLVEYQVKLWQGICVMKPEDHFLEVEVELNKDQIKIL